jgi:hypothetical protein
LAPAAKQIASLEWRFAKLLVLITYRFREFPRKADVL